MIFKGVKVEIGDIVSFQTRVVPLPEVQAAVVDVVDGVLEVISTFLVPFQHSGQFREADVDRIMVVYPAAVAIPQESRGRGFFQGQIVSAVLKDDQEHRGEVIAAFDGIVVARQSDGQLFTGGAMRFHAVN